jgi:hypothetical protein
MEQGLPSVTGLRPLVVMALKEAGGSASTADLRERVHRLGRFTASQLDQRHGTGPGAELSYRLRWALVDLRRRGMIVRRAPRIWELVEAPIDRSADSRPAGPEPQIDDSR